MTLFRRLICGCAVAAVTAASGASVASASTFYVEEHLGSPHNPCTKELPCPTIKEAVESSEAVPGPNTIEVLSSEEPAYKESLVLNSKRDQGLTINGIGAEVAIRNTGAPALTVNAAAGSVTLSNLKVEAQTGEHAVIADHGAELTLDDAFVENESSAGVNGVEAGEGGTLTIDGGTVEMANGASGYAVDANATPLALDGVSVIDGALGEAGGVSSTKSGLSMQSSNVTIESGIKEEDVGIATEEDGAVSLQSVSVKQYAPALAMAFSASPTTIDGAKVDMANPSTKAEAVGGATLGAPLTAERLEVEGTWPGAAFLGLGGKVTLSDSKLIANTSKTAPAVDYVGFGEGNNLLIQRSLLQAGPEAERGALATESANVTVDSSEVLGGVNGVYFSNKQAGARTLTIAGSTIDAGATGVTGDAFGVHGVEVEAKGTSASTASALIEGSIVLEQQASNDEAGDEASVSCSYSSIPEQSRPAKGTEGALACAAGTNGNTSSAAELGSLFSEPFKTYELSPSSSAIDSVPVSAITLPFGLTPSSTDRVGNLRFEDLDCVAFQDKGALQLQGHSTPCPVTAIPISAPISTPKPLAGVITALRISPSAFLPAPSGATISRAKKKTKRKYGATISYRDSQQATTTFTVLRKSSGRRQGKSCKAPSKKNKRGKPCTLLSKVGSFTHVDLPAANSLHFSGRLKGKQLPAGTYELQAVAHDGAGNGATVTASFTIK
jgi:hypothetical protein